MTACVGCMVALLTVAPPETLGPGDHVRTIDRGGDERSYVVHLPKQFDPTRPTPVVLSFHGALTNGRTQQRMSGLDAKADAEGFVVVYPNGTGTMFTLLFWNAGALPNNHQLARKDDVAFVGTVLDDLATFIRVDPRRVYACGMSNGAMMCHRLATELPDRIAAVACVAGTLALPKPEPGRAVPVLQIHGTDDTFAPWAGRGENDLTGWRFRGVDETIAFWVAHNRCAAQPETASLPNRASDGQTSQRFVYRSADRKADVVLIKINGGGHTWPGHKLPAKVFGPTTTDFDANDEIWDFFTRNPLP